MKLCFSTLACPERTVDQIISAASQWGMDGVELRAASGTGELWTVPDLCDSRLAATRRRFADAGVSVPVVAAGTCFTDPALSARKAAQEELERFCVIAQGLGSPFVRVFGGPLQPEQPYTEGFRQSLEAFRKGAEMAARYGVTLLLETHDDFSTSPRVRAMVEAMEGKLGVVWDVLHPCRFGETPDETFQMLKDSIRHVHIKDALLRPNHSFENALPGQGQLPIPRAVELMEDSGYQGWYCFEWERMWWPHLLAAEKAVPIYGSYMRSLTCPLHSRTI